LAYELSTSVLEWHALDTWEERIEYGVCVKWKPAKEVENADGDQEMDDGRELARQDPLDAGTMDALGSSGSSGMVGIEDESDDEEEEQNEVVNPLETSNEIQGAMDSSAEMREVEEQAARQPTNVEPKQEEVDDSVSLQRVGERGSSVKEEASGLKPTSNDPMLGSKSSSHSLNGDAEESKSSTSKAKISVYAPLRAKIAYEYYDKFFIGPEDLQQVAEPESGEKGEEEGATLHSLSLETLFPELQPYGMLDVAPPSVVDPAKKKSSRSSEKDDPNKRIDEVGYTKVMPTGTFMTVKPTLLGPLHPSKRWKDGKWLPMEEFSVTPDPESTNRITEESLCGMFSR